MTTDLDKAIQASIDASIVDDLNIDLGTLAAAAPQYGAAELSETTVAEIKAEDVHVFSHGKATDSPDVFQAWFCSFNGRAYGPYRARADACYILGRLRTGARILSEVRELGIDI